MILSDTSILERLALPDSDPLRLRVEPLARGYDLGRISNGLSSAGYDVTLGRSYRVFTSAGGAVMDPKAVDPACFKDLEADCCLVPANSFVLGVSVEKFRIPRDVIAMCIGKSTYHRCGIIAACTPLEPEWEGHITVEIGNSGPCPARVYSGEGILQVNFHLLHGACAVSYADKRGRYQGQGPDVVTARVQR